MPNTKTLPVPHLDGITAAYQSPQPYDPRKPTIVLINAFTTSSELYRDQFANKQLTDLVNLLAIEVLGHGQTRTKREHWTFWDSAEMNLQVLDELKIERAFVLGTSQGGWVAMRMALMRPEKVAGVITLGSSMDYESSISRQLHCWDAPTLLSPAISQLSTSHPTPDFLPDPDYCDFLVDTGFGKDNCPAEVREFWRNNIRENYMGDDGRRRIWMAAVNLRDRDGLHSRLGDIRCPVLWLHGTQDAAYSMANAEREIKLFVNSPDVSLVPIEGGAHFLGATHPREVDAEIVKFVTKYSFIPKYSKIER